MSTITAKLAAALEIARDALTPYMDYCSEGGPNAAMRAHTEAQDALAEYNDASRPPEPGDRVRVIGDRYRTPGLAAGGTGTVVGLLGDVRRVKMDGEDTFVTRMDWEYMPADLERIA